MRRAARRPGPSPRFSGRSRPCPHPPRRPMPQAPDRHTRKSDDRAVSRRPRAAVLRSARLRSTRRPASVTGADSALAPRRPGTARRRRRETAGLAVRRKLIRERHRAGSRACRYRCRPAEGRYRAACSNPAMAPASPSDLEPRRQSSSSCKRGFRIARGHHREVAGVGRSDLLPQLGIPGQQLRGTGVSAPRSFSQPGRARAARRQARGHGARIETGGIPGNENGRRDAQAPANERDRESPPDRARQQVAGRQTRRPAARDREEPQLRESRDPRAEKRHVGDAGRRDTGREGRPELPRIAQAARVRGAGG